MGLQKGSNVLKSYNPAILQSYNSHRLVMTMSPLKVRIVTSALPSP